MDYIPFVRNIDFDAIWSRLNEMVFYDLIINSVLCYIIRLIAYRLLKKNN